MRNLYGKIILEKLKNNMTIEQCFIEVKKNFKCKTNQEVLNCCEKLYEYARKKKMKDVYQFESRLRAGMSANLAPESEYIK